MLKLKVLWNATLRIKKTCTHYNRSHKASKKVNLLPCAIKVAHHKEVSFLGGKASCDKYRTMKLYTA